MIDWIDTASVNRVIEGAARLVDPVDDAILTLGVRMHNPLSYDEIASLFGMGRDDVSKICEPYKVFLRTAEDVAGFVRMERAFPQSISPPCVNLADILFGPSHRQWVIQGEERLADPVDDAILTLGVRMHNPLSYDKIASLLDMNRDDVSEICEPYKELHVYDAGVGNFWLPYPRQMS